MQVELWNLPWFREDKNLHTLIPQLFGRRARPQPTGHPKPTTYCKSPVDNGKCQATEKQRTRLLPLRRTHCEWRQRSLSTKCCLLARQVAGRSSNTCCPNLRSCAVVIMLWKSSGGILVRSSMGTRSRPVKRGGAPGAPLLGHKHKETTVRMMYGIPQHSNPVSDSR